MYTHALQMQCKCNAHAMQKIHLLCTLFLFFTLLFFTLSFKQEVQANYTEQLQTSGTRPNSNNALRRHTAARETINPLDDVCIVRRVFKSLQGRVAIHPSKQSKITSCRTRILKKLCENSGAKPLALAMGM